MTPQVFQIGERVTYLPVIHGSGDVAIAVRRFMLQHSFDCVAVPLPPSFQSDVEQAVELLPLPTIVVQREVVRESRPWTPDSDEPSDDAEQEFDSRCSYVPIDPCQPVIAALRSAIGERLPRRFIDLETAHFEPHSLVLPDPYALKTVALERFAPALLPSVPPPPTEQARNRVRHMAHELRRLSVDFRSILMVGSVLDWPWVREAYFDTKLELPSHELVEPVESYDVAKKSRLFLFGELPFITWLYERARADLDADDNLSIDGVKELLIAARQSYQKEFGRRARKITPFLLSQCLKYTRNLTLLDRRLTPDLFSIVISAKQVLGDQFAIHVAECARDYRIDEKSDRGTVTMGIDQGRLPDTTIAEMVSRLPGPPIYWRSCELNPRPDKKDLTRWQARWNPFSQCSWPPEDTEVERFRAHVFDRARAVMGADLARTEKFTTSLKDGLDIRETLRHWYDGELYVKVLPPSRGKLDCAVMLFDSPADPREYPWRTTWFAEHKEESTLAFFATDFNKELVGPGIGVSTYGGALFLFPPVSIPDIWTDRRLDFTTTLEERILAAACLHSRSPHIALLSHQPPGLGWRRLAQRFRRKFVHVPLNQFSDATIQQLRMVHVLNGKDVRSYAAHFIRKA